MIAIVDYGVGNLFSLTASLTAVGATAVVSGDERELARADKLILPGVGAFGDAIDKLVSSGLVPTIKREAQRKPLLGICLGMQLLFERSCEYGSHDGLALLEGEIAPLRGDLADSSLKVPHIGWNSLEALRGDELLSGFKSGEYVYYVHSYYAKNCERDTLAVSRYGGAAIPGLVRRGTVWGAQFHPEKSGAAGLGILKAFAEL